MLPQGPNLEVEHGSTWNTVPPKPPGKRRNSAKWNNENCLSLTRMIWIIKHASVKAVTEPLRWQVSRRKTGQFGLLNLSNKFYFFFFLKKWLYLYNVIRVPRELILHFITGRSSEKAMATHSSILARRIPLTEEPGRLQPTVSQSIGHTHMG